MHRRILTLAALCVGLGSSGSARADRLVVCTPAAPRELTVELATTPQAWARGLMHRRHLPDHAGMLFVFPHSSRRTFWMRDTPLALDMLFLNDQAEVVEIVRQATPCSDRARGGTVESRYVLEVAGSWAARFGVRLGTRVALPESLR